MIVGTKCRNELSFLGEGMNLKQAIYIILLYLANDEEEDDPCMNNNDTLGN